MGKMLTNKTCTCVFLMRLTLRHIAYKVNESQHNFHKVENLTICKYLG